MTLKDGNEPTEDSNLLNSDEKKPQELARESSHLQSLRRILACPPHGWLSRVVTNGVYMAGMNSEKKMKVTVRVPKTIQLKGQKKCTSFVNY